MNYFMSSQINGHLLNNNIHLLVIVIFVCFYYLHCSHYYYFIIWFAMVQNVLLQVPESMFMICVPWRLIHLQMNLVKIKASMVGCYQWLWWTVRLSHNDSEFNVMQFHVLVYHSQYILALLYTKLITVLSAICMFIYHTHPCWYGMSFTIIFFFHY